MKLNSEEGNHSPRLLTLQQALANGDATALPTFWQEMAERGTPLIEPLAGDDTHVLVTFLWRSADELKNVVVISNLVGWDFAENQMMQLPTTDLWYRTYRLRADAQAVYRLSPDDPLIPWHKIEQWEAHSRRWQPDPLNPAGLVFAADDETPDSTASIWSIAALPAAPPQPWITPQPGIPAGQLESYRLPSNILENERRVWVYTPPGYTANNEPYGLLLLFDGWDYHHVIPAPTILDNLLAAGRIPPLVAVLIDNAPGARSRELPCYPPFVEFLAQELLPWLRQRYQVTTEPMRTIIGGLSYGGLAATHAGLRRPDLFGNILSQSGSFWWKPEDDPEYEWLARQFVAAPLLPLRFYLDVGLLEGENPPGRRPNQLVANRHMRNLLQAKGYLLHYVEYNGGHDYLIWRGTLADGLLALVGK